MSYKIRIEKIGGRGMGIGRLDGKVVFVPFTVPGDEVVVKTVKEKKSFINAALLEVTIPSPDRITAPCPHFGQCGGCSHQNILYEKQCTGKTAFLNEIFRKYTGGGTELERIVPSERNFSYRNKMQLQCEELGGRLISGFYRFGSHRIVEIKECLLYSSDVNKLKNETTMLLNKYGIPAYSKRKRRGIVKGIVIRESRQPRGLQLTIISAKKRIRSIEKIAEELLMKIPDLKGFYTYHHPSESNIAFHEQRGATKHGGADSSLTRITGKNLTETLINTRFRISPAAFFQVNSDQTKKIINRIKAILAASGSSGDGLIDAFAGIGTLSLPLAAGFKRILGIEYSEGSSRLGAENARLNGITNYTPRTGDAEKVLRGLLKEDCAEVLAGTYPCLLLDPPRSGLSGELARLIATVPFQTVLYLSCNPHTQVRDLDRIMEGGRYKVTRLIPYDMFPHTFHTECLAVLEKLT